MTDQRTPRLTRGQMLADDLRLLMQDKKFRRFAYCILMDANVLRGGYGADVRSFPFWEGRRSLGLDILAVLQGVDPDALLAILAEEKLTRMETTDGRRRTSDRRDELGSDLDGRDRNDRTTFLEYGAD